MVGRTEAEAEWGVFVFVCLFFRFFIEIGWDFHPFEETEDGPVKSYNNKYIQITIDTLDTDIYRFVAILIIFLDAASHLYKRVCPFTRRSVRPSLCPLRLFENHSFRQFWWKKSFGYTFNNQLTQTFVSPTETPSKNCGISWFSRANIFGIKPWENGRGIDS